MALRLIPTLRTLSMTGVRAMSGGDFGSGSGKGGGSGGSIRDAGGAFGKMEAAHEEQYFRKQREDQLKAFREQREREKQLNSDDVPKSQDQQAEQITLMKEHMAELMRKELEENIKHHEDVIKTNQEAIARQKRRMMDLEGNTRDTDSD